MCLPISAEYMVRMDASERKQHMRPAMLRRRKAQPLELQTVLSAAILEWLFQTLSWHTYQTVHVYTSNNHLGEVSTEQIKSWLAEHYPNIRCFTSPCQVNPPIPHENFDCIIVPVVAFDARLHRIGMGGSWYDRFLAGQPQAYKVGLAYEWQRAARIPREPHDISLDCVITEKKVYTAP